MILVILNVIMYYISLSSVQQGKARLSVNTRSIACGAKFMFTGGNHTLKSLSTYPFPVFPNEWGLDEWNVARAWDNHGDIMIGNDVWIGGDTVIMQGVKITFVLSLHMAVVSKDVAPLFNRRRNTGKGDTQAF